VTVQLVLCRGLSHVTLPARKDLVMSQLLLSLYPSIGMLDKGFEDCGFCVVRSPDLIFGGDIRKFYPPSGKFDGVFGGSPCQDFSTKRRTEPTGYGIAMLCEFVRVVKATNPLWWLLENVPAVPDVYIDGYQWQRLDVRASEFGLKQRRLRHIQFGYRDGLPLVVPRNDAGASEPTVLASDTSTAWGKLCELQGLPVDFDIPAFTIKAKRRAVGNGVPIPMARALASAITDREKWKGVKLCACSCGRPVAGKKTMAKSSCRKTMQRRREKNRQVEKTRVN